MVASLLDEIVGLAAGIIDMVSSLLNKVVGCVAGVIDIVLRPFARDDLSESTSYHRWSWLVFERKKLSED